MVLTNEAAQVAFLASFRQLRQSILNTCNRVMLYTWPHRLPALDEPTAACCLKVEGCAQTALHRFSPASIRWCCNTLLPQVTMPAPKRKYRGKYQHTKKEVVASLLELLPENALFAIAESLAEVEPGGVRGPSLVARDLCSLELVSGITKTSSMLCSVKLMLLLSLLLLLLPVSAHPAVQVQLPCPRLAAMLACTSQSLHHCSRIFHLHFCTARRTASLTRSCC
jgi:hypothetical protein